MEQIIKCTSICHCPNSNYQIDYSGLEHSCIQRFEKWCMENETKWGHLLNEETGILIATYDKTQGLLAIKTLISSDILPKQLEGNKEATEAMTWENCYLAALHRRYPER